MVYAFENYDFETMNMLVAKGADINPCIDEDYYFGPNLINFALSKYRDKPNNKNMQGIQWFAKFTKLLASESSEFTSLAEEVVDWDDDKVKNELGVKYFEELRKEYEELEKEFESFERQLKAEYSLVQLNRYSSDYPERVEVSILNDLFREKRVIPVSNIWDVKFSRVRDKLWVAVYFNNEPYPLSIPLPEELIQHYSGKLSGLDLFSATEFHSIFWFIKTDAMNFYCIEALANKHNRDVFFKVDDKPVVSIMNNYYINSLIKSGDLFIDNKVSRNFLSISDKILYAEHRLLDFGVFDECDVPGEMALPSDCFNSISDRASIKISFLDDVPEEQYNNYCLYVKKDMIWDFLCRGPIEKVIGTLIHYLPESHLLNRCSECGELGLVREMAYGEVHDHCM